MDKHLPRTTLGSRLDKSLQHVCPTDERTRHFKNGRLNNPIFPVIHPTLRRINLHEPIKPKPNGNRVASQMLSHAGRIRATRSPFSQTFGGHEQYDHKNSFVE